MRLIHLTASAMSGDRQSIYLRCSIGLSTVAPGRQGAALSQTLGRITNHGFLLLLVGGIVILIATVSLVVQHLALAVGHVGKSRMLHGGGVGKSPTIKRGVRLRRRQQSFTRSQLFTNSP